MKMSYPVNIQCDNVHNVNDSLETLALNSMKLYRNDYHQTIVVFFGFIHNFITRVDNRNLHGISLLVIKKINVHPSCNYFKLKSVLIYFHFRNNCRQCHYSSSLQILIVSTAHHDLFVCLWDQYK